MPGNKDNISVTILRDARIQADIGRSLEMEINLNASKMPVLPPEMPATTAMDATDKHARSSMTISTREFAPIVGSEEVDAATEADVSTRDDAIGKLFQQAFSYQPPPMPNFL